MVNFQYYGADINIVIQRLKQQTQRNIVFDPTPVLSCQEPHAMLRVSSRSFLIVLRGGSSFLFFSFCSLLSGPLHTTYVVWCALLLGTVNRFLCLPIKQGIIFLL